MIRSILIAIMLPMTALAQDFDVASLRESDSFDLSISFPEELHIAVAIAEDKFMFDHQDMSGSKITQQLARNFLLSGTATAERKVQEIALARQLAVEFSRDEILSMWLQQVYFGKLCYGIEDAAEAMLDIPFEEAGMREYLTLLAVIKAPSVYVEDQFRLAGRYSLIVQEAVESELLSPETAANLLEDGAITLLNRSCKLEY